METDRWFAASLGLSGRATDLSAAAAVASSSIEQRRCDSWIGGRQLTRVVLLDIDGGPPVQALHGAEHRQPPGNGLLAGAIVGEQDDLVGNEAAANEIYQGAGVGGVRVAGNDNLLRGRQAEVECRC